MANDLQANLQSYVLQLQQVEAALTIDPDNEELQKLKEDLDEVLTLTKDLLKQQQQSGSGYAGEEGGGGGAKSGGDAAAKKKKLNNKVWAVGDKCMALSSDDGQYYEGVIEDFSEDGEQSSVRLVHNSVVEQTGITFLQTVKPPKKTAQHKKQTQNQREYQKKKKLKKQQKYKQLEEERETEKNKWLAFTTRKKGGGFIAKKSIFASPDSVTGRVGIGTCGVSGLPMTEFSHAEKRKKGT